MKKKNFLNAAFWTVIMIVLQVVVDLVRHTAINWIEVLIGGAIVFFICIGAKPNPVVVKKNKDSKTKTPENASQNKNISPDGNVAKNDSGNNANNMNVNMNDLRFYAYNRIAMFSLAIGVGCIVYGYIKHVENAFWLYLVGGVCLVQAIVFFVLYAKKREEFVAKEKNNKVGKK